MKTKRTSRFIAFALVVLMLVPMISLSATALSMDDIIADIDEDAAIFVSEDFNNLTTNEDGTAVTKPSDNTSISGLNHKYSKLMQRGDAEDDSFILIPHKSDAGVKDGGNWDKCIYFNNTTVSSEQTNGVILSMDLFLHFDESLNTTNCGYEYTGSVQDPTTEIQFQAINGVKSNGQSYTANWITLGQINMRTGEIKLVNGVVEGAEGLKLDQWNTLQYEFDMVHGTYKLYVNGKIYTELGYLSGNGSAGGNQNVNIPAGKLIIGKCNKNGGAYNGNDTKKDTEGNDVPFPYEEMTYVGVDNVIMYENVGYVSEPLGVEKLLPGQLSGSSFTVAEIGKSPMDYGFGQTPSSVTIVQDPTDASNKAAKLIFNGYKEGYMLWGGSNNNTNYQLTDIVWKDGDESTGVIVSAKAGSFTVHGNVWGDTLEEQSTGTAGEDGIAYDEAGNALTCNYKGTDYNYYIVTGTWFDCKFGGSNVAKPFNPTNPAISADKYSKIAMQCRYYVSSDMAGNMEVQLNGSTGAWIDTVVISAAQDGDVTLLLGGNCCIVNGSDMSQLSSSRQGILLERETWYTIHVVYDLATNTEDIFLNGEFIAQVCPRNNNFTGIRADSWSIAKVQRGTPPANMGGYLLVDDVYMFDVSAFDKSELAINYIQNFDSLTDVSDVTATGVPADATLVDRADHGKALQTNIADLTGDLIFASAGTTDAVATKVAFDFELNFSADATGVLTGKLLKYGDRTMGGSYDVSTGFWADGIKSDLKLYSIDAATGAILLGDQIGAANATTATTLTKGEWYTISYVLNLVTGEVDLYINNRWVAAGTVGATNINFTASQWSFATVADATAVAGTLTVDDVRFMVVTDEVVDITADRENFVSATFNGEAVKLGDRFFVTDDVNYEEVLFDPTAYAKLLTARKNPYDVAFREVNPTGLRFTTKVNTNLLAELKEIYGEENVTMGTIIVPTDSVELVNVTFADLEKNSIAYLDVVAPDFYEDGIFAGSIVNLKEENINRSFTAVGYVKITMSLGNSAVIYSDTMTNNLAKVASDYVDEADEADIEGALGVWLNYYASFKK